MTQSVTNTMNNLEKMFLTQENKTKMFDSVASSMDKSADFKKVFDRTLKKDSSTINDVKASKATETKALENVVVNDDIVQNSKKQIVSAEFKEIIRKATDESSVEDSLDLTLAKDINEIISQLKEAVENVDELAESDSESLNTDASQEDEVVYNLSILENTMPTLPEEPVVDLKEDGLVKESASNLVSTLVSNLTDKKDGQILEIKSNLSEDTSFEVSDDILSESIELLENGVEEAVSTKQVDTSLVNEIENILDEEAIKDLKIESLSSETDTSSQDNLMQNQTPEEHAVKAMINSDAEAFDVKIDSIQKNFNTQQVQVKSDVSNPSRILEQISRQLDGLQNNSKVSIVLNPESLGKVNISLMTTKEGLTAQFTVTTQEAKDLLTRGLDGLKDALASHGVGVDNVSVKVADSQKAEYKQDWTEQDGSRGGNKGHKNPNREEKEKGLFENMMEQASSDENGNV